MINYDPYYLGGFRTIADFVHRLEVREEFTFAGS